MRIFVLGDSFAQNTFKACREGVKNYGFTNKTSDTMGDYVEKVLKETGEDPLHFTDYLTQWGHEVIDLGLNGCSNYAIWYSMSRMGEFKDGDRMIINWTGIGRFDWVEEGDRLVNINGGQYLDYKTNPSTRFLFDQFLLRTGSSSLLYSMGPFTSHLLNLHEKYKPIMWIPTPFPHEFFDIQRFFFPEPSHHTFKDIIPEFGKMHINEECDVNDFHYGRWGNFYAAVIFNYILQYTQDIHHDGYYAKDLKLFDGVVQVIKNSKPEIKTLKDPGNIVGREQVLNSLREGKNIRAVLIQSGITGKEIEDIIQAARSLKIPIEFVTVEKLQSLSKRTHEGVIAISSELSLRKDLL
jgi:hypothetical protein